MLLLYPLGALLLDFSKDRITLFLFVRVFFSVCFQLNKYKLNAFYRLSSDFFFFCFICNTNCSTNNQFLSLFSAADQSNQILLFKFFLIQQFRMTQTHMPQTRLTWYLRFFNVVYIFFFYCQFLWLHIIVLSITVSSRE